MGGDAVAAGVDAAAPFEQDLAVGAGGSGYEYDNVVRARELGQLLVAAHLDFIEHYIFRIRKDFSFHLGPFDI